ncbi:MAG: YidC/Oxa1 family membrane protein insertase [Peptococcaceae bacterium]|nr:YidC/Oxa1 family membrane protein insertase [Peptococcaceae bacterium]
MINILMGFLLKIYQLTEFVGFPSFAFSIFIFAILIKIVLFPLAYKQSKSMKYMQAIQPKIQFIQKKYKDNKEKINAETMALYKKHSVNPMAGCLPLLIQMPILIALFQTLREFDYSQLGEAGRSFFWVSSLDTPDPWVLPILVALSTFLQSKFSMAMTPQPQAAEGNAKTMQISMQYIMPLMMGWFAKGYPAGLSIYWITFSLLSLVQQWITNAMMKNIELELDADDVLDEKEEKKIAKVQRVKKLKMPVVKKEKGEHADRSEFGKPLDFSDKRRK